MASETIEYISLVDLIKDYYETRGLKWPTAQQAVFWIITEVAEACEQLLGMEGGWVRNNPDDHDESSDVRFAEELGDVIMTEFTPGGATPPTDQHFVIALELDGGDLIIADPWTGEIARLLDRYALANWDLARAIYGARLFGHEGEAPPPPPPPLSRNLLGIHQQKEAGGVLEYYASAHPAVYKTVKNFQFVQAIKERSPNTITMCMVAGMARGLDPFEAMLDKMARKMGMERSFVEVTDRDEEAQ